MAVWEGQATAFCPAAPVWEQVRLRQGFLGLSDDEMCEWLGWHPTVVDARADGLMSKGTAARILRALAEPRPAPPKLADRLRRRDLADRRQYYRTQAKAS